MYWHVPCLLLIYCGWMDGWTLIRQKYFKPCFYFSVLMIMACKQQKQKKDILKMVRVLKGLFIYVNLKLDRSFFHDLLHHGMLSCNGGPDCFESSLQLICMFGLVSLIILLKLPDRPGWWPIKHSMVFETDFLELFLLGNPFKLSLLLQQLFQLMFYFLSTLKDTMQPLNSFFSHNIQWLTFLVERETPTVFTGEIQFDLQIQRWAVTSFFNSVASIFKVLLQYFYKYFFYFYFNNNFIKFCYSTHNE